MNQSRRGSNRPSLKGDLVVEGSNEQAFDARQIELLEAIRSSGSISAAAKQVGVSYKTAWDRIDAMNNLSEQALVARSAGGAHGGGTRLTEFGEEVLSGLQALQSEHADFVSRLGENLDAVGGVSKFLQQTNLRSSARNQFRGRIARLATGTVNTEVVVALSDSVEIVAIITNDSLERMELETGHEVIALIKSSWVMLSTDTAVATSARNKLCGRVSHISPGGVNAEVSIDLGDGKSLCAMITATSCEALGLATGTEVAALFKASSVILMRA
ncbi:MAG: TOBE domain-containing protein [Gammaproteobacteria bacterium]